MDDRIRRARRHAPKMLLVVGAATLAVLVYARFGAAPPADTDAANDSDPPTIVEIETIRRMDMPVDIVAVGTVEPENSVLVKSRVDGRIVSIGFAEGAEVVAGHILFRIDPRPLQAELRRAHAVHATSAERLSNARRDLDRLRSLAEQKLVSMQMLDTARSQVEQLEDATAAERAEVDRLRLQAEETIVRAPLSGRTGERLVDVGNVVRADDDRGLVVIAQLHPVLVAFPLPGEALASVRAEQRRHGPLRVSVHDRDGDNLLAEGELRLIDNMIDTATGTIKLKARFRNENEVLWPGDFVQVRLRLETRRNVLAVPASALQDGPEGRFVYRVGANDEVAIQPVAVGLCDRGLCIIERGLDAGASVVTDGQHKLDAGMRVASPKSAVARSKDAGG